MGRVDFPRSTRVTVTVPTGYPSSPLRLTQTLRQQPCVNAHGELVAADAFSPYDPEDSGR